MKDDKKPPPSPDDATLVPENMRPVSGAHRDAAATLTPVPESKAFPAQTISGETIAPEAVAPKRAPMSAGYWGSPTALPAGTVLAGRYEILQLLGEGGMGAVYKATDRELERTVALKVIRPELAGNPAIIQRFKQELILARQVTHRNVIRIYDLGEAEGMKFITMEYVEGRDLHSLLLERQKFTPEEAVDIMQQVCLALDAAHREGVIHRDLKPQNIMRDAQGRVVVMDFGLARSLEANGGMTQSGALIGTMEYMSPEQALGTELDQRSDLFTVGLIFYELLSGKTPYKADTALASLLKRTQERAIPVAELESKVPRGLSNVVSRCLERDLKLRYQTAQELLNDLSAWQGNKAAASLGFAAVRPWGQGFPWVAASVLLVVLLLAGTGYIFRDKLFSKSTTAKSATAGPEVSLAILPFRNASGDPSLDWLGPSLADMVATDVGQSSHLRTISSDRLHQLLHDLKITAESSVDPPMLRRIAEFSSADTVVWGQYARFGEQIRLDATIQDLKHDRRATLKAEAASEKDVPQAIDRLAEAIRQNLSFSPDVLKELRASSFQPSSKSVAALREYNKGAQLLREGKNLESLKSLQSATKEDPQFALAFSRLAEVYSALGYDSEADQSARKAVELDENLPAAEKYLITANQARVAKDYPKAIAAYEELAKVSPDNAEIQFALGGLYENTGSFNDAQTHYAKVLQAIPNDVATLLAIGRVDIESGDPQKSMDPLNRGLSLAIQVDNKEQEALIRQALGIGYAQLNKLDEALKNYQQSLEIKQRLGQKKGIADSLNMMADVYERMGKSDQELTYYQQALAIYREIGDKHDAGTVLLNLGQFYDDRGKYDDGLKYLRESLQIQRDAGDEALQALCLNNIGNTYFVKGDYETARTYFEQSLHLREKIKVPSDIADSLHNLAETSMKLGQLDQALTQNLRALDLRRNNGDKAGAAKESDSMGILFAYQGRFGAALKAREESMNAFRELQERSYWMAETLGGYGNALSQVGREDDGAKRLAEALTLARELKNEALVSQILDWQGDNFLYQGDLKSARNRYDESLKLASKTSDHDLQIMLKLTLAKLSLQEGHEQGTAATLRKLAEQANSAGLKYVAIDASLHAVQSSLETGGFTSSRQELERLLNDGEKLGARPLQAKAHLLLGAILRLSGNKDDAAREYRNAIQMMNEMGKDAGDRFMHRADIKAISDEATRWSQF